MPRPGRLGRGPMTLVGLILLGSLDAPALAGQGHGPIYGLSTPTLGRGAWSLDVGGMARSAEGDGRLVMLRPMLGYGLTEDLHLFASVPVPVHRDPGLPSSRAFTRMPSSRDLEAGLGWRFQRRGLDVGSRQETTLWIAVDQPLEATRRGVATSPGAFAALVTGYASRTVYLWAGGGHRRYVGSDGSRPGDTTMGSLVFGYRPPFFRDDYPRPDWRGFVEIVGEWMDEDIVDGGPVGDTGGRQVYIALTALGLYGSWGIAGGPAFPVVQELDGPQAKEGIRFALNVTFWW